MKKNYISPVVRNINLDTESLLAGSPILEKKQGEIDNVNDVMSNGRDASSSIWGED